MFSGTIVAGTASHPAGLVAGTKFLLFTATFAATDLNNKAIFGQLHVWAVARGAPWSGVETVDCCTLTWGPALASGGAMN